MSYTLFPLRKARLQRSELAVPGSNPRLIDKAVQERGRLRLPRPARTRSRRADKEQARKNIIEALRDIDWRGAGKTVSVRINGLDTHYMYRDVVDIMEQAGDRLDTILIPKVGVPADVYMVEASSPDRGGEGLHEQGRHRSADRDARSAWPTSKPSPIEPAGSRRCISASRTTPRARRARVSIGGLNPDYPGDQWHFALSRMIVACRAYGLRPIDGPFGDFTDPDGYRAGAGARPRSASRASGRSIPSQIALANEVFTPTAKPKSSAHERILVALEEAEAQGKGAAQLDGKMIDAASATDGQEHRRYRRRDQPGRRPPSA